MNILQISNFFYLLGGGSRYFFEVSKLLRKNGHRIAYFSMQDPKNFKSKWNKYFVSNISFEKVEINNGLKVLGRMLYSIEARRKISELLDNFPCDIVHLHDIYHHISPSILLEFKKRNIPVIQTLGDYHLIYPNYIMFHHGHICEITKPNKYSKSILHKCIKDSYLASFAETLEKYFHKSMAWERYLIDYYIAPSDYMMNKLIDYGINKSKIIHQSYFIDSSTYKQKYDQGKYILYFGRLSSEKGLINLIIAMKILYEIRLIIAGTGSQEKELKILNNALGNRNIEFVGFQDGKNLKKLISESRFTVLPSVWYEVFGLSILESFTSGKPVIASDIGGIPEIVKNGINGYLFEAGSIDDCAEKINKLWNNPSLCLKMGKNARELVEKNFSPEEHYEKLMSIYKMAISKHR